MTLPEKFRVHVITMSDRAYSGDYADVSGPTVVTYVNDAVALRTALEEEPAADLVFITGGTGIGPRDITPDVVRPMLTKEIPGIMEQIRVKYGMMNPKALLSRAVAGTIGNNLIYTLPGSVKAVHEYMAEIVKTLEHTFYMLYGIDIHGKGSRQ